MLYHLRQTVLERDPFSLYDAGLSILRGRLGDANIPGLYTTQRGVRAVGNVVGVWDDYRCEKPNGRYYFPGVSGEVIDCGAYTALNGAAKVSFLIVFSPSVTTAMSLVSGRSSTGWTVYLQGSDNVRLYTSGPNSAGASFAAVGDYAAGDVIALGIGFDGAATTHTTVYAAKYTAATDSWAALTGLAVSSDLTDSTFNTADANLNIGAQNGGASNSVTGFIDDVRIFENVTLTQAQFQTELNAFAAKSGTSPNGANRWYSFDGNANNIGTSPGNNGTPTSNVVLCSDDCRWGPALASAGTNRPAYASGVVTFDGVNDYLRGFRGRLGELLGSIAVPSIGAVPPVGSLNSGVVGVSPGTSTYALRTYVDHGANGLSATDQSNFPMTTLPGDTLTRVIHGRRLQSGGNSTTGIQLGAHAEVTAGPLAVADSAPDRITIGASLFDSPSEFAAMTFVAAILYTGDYSGKQSLVNQWAQQYCGATL